MADDFDSSKYLKAFDPSAPTARTSFNYEAFLGDVGTMAQQTREVSVPSPKGAYKAAKDVIRGPGYKKEAPYQQLKALMQDYRTQAETTKARAEKAATALEMKGATTVQSMQNLEALQAEARTQQGKGETLWMEAAKKAGEYVDATRSRTVQTLRELDNLFEGMNTDRDYAKAHAMQAGVQATLGAMESEGRAITEKYGVDSKEFQVFTEKKMKSLGNMQSQIEVGYANVIEEANKNYLSARTGAAEKMHMYTGFQEQQHVETLMGMARSSESYALQTSQFMLAVEQMKMAGMDDLANWMIGTPEFSMELAPIVSAITMVGTTFEAEKAAKKAERGSALPGASSPLGKLGGMGYGMTTVAM